jgi:hypothetical protein
LVFFSAAGATSVGFDANLGNGKWAYPQFQ